MSEIVGVSGSTRMGGPLARNSAASGYGVSRCDVRSDPVLEMADGRGLTTLSDGLRREQGRALRAEWNHVEN